MDYISIEIRDDRNKCLWLELRIKKYHIYQKEKHCKSKTGEGEEDINLYYRDLSLRKLTNEKREETISCDLSASFATPCICLTNSVNEA